MIVIDRPKLKFLLAGRVIEVDVQREYRKGGCYALGTSHKRSVCRVLVVDSAEREDGWRLTVKQMSGDEVRLLARSSTRGYVTAPVEANPDDPDVLRGAAVHEPEALSDAQVRDLTKYRAAAAQNGHARSVTELRDRVMADLDAALRTTISREDRDKIRAARHHLGKLGRAS